MRRRNKFKKYPGLRAGPSPIAGMGCFATKSFKEGDRVGEYTGERISNEEADDRYEDLEMTYLFEINEEECIDALHDANPVKFINHSCDANCESIQEGERVFIYALRDVQEGEELTYDYHLIVEKGEEQDHPCSCGSSKCRGTMAEPHESDE